MIIQLPKREFTEKENNVYYSIFNKIMEEFDFQNDDLFRDLSNEEQYFYLGLIEGMNNVLKIMTEDNNPEVIKFIEAKFEVESEEDAIKRMEKE